MFKLHSFVPFLKFFLSWLMCMAVGDSALAAIGGDSAVVLDPGDDEGGGDEGLQGDQQGGAPADDQQDQDQDGKEKPGDKRTQQPAQDGGKGLSPAAKTKLNEIKAENPALWKELSKPRWDLLKVEKQISEAFGEEGIEGAIQAKTQVDNFLQETGYTDLQGVRTELNDFRATDGKIIKGDSTFVNDLPGEVQEGIFKMVPDFIGQWSKRDPESYGRYFLPLVLATLRDSGVENVIRYSLRDLQRMGTDNADVKALYDQIKGAADWLDKNWEETRKPVEKKQAAAAPDPKLQERLNNAEKVERQQAINRVGDQVIKAKPKVYSTAIKAHFGGKVPDYVNMPELVRRTQIELLTILGQTYYDNFNRYLSAGDEAGAAKYTIREMTANRVQQAAERAAKRLYKPATLGSQTRGNGNTNQNNQQNQRGGGANNQRQATPGVATLNFNPTGDQMDIKATEKWARELGTTAFRLMASNRGVVKGKGRCDWSAYIRKEREGV